MDRYDKTYTNGKMMHVGKAHSYLGNAHVGLRNYESAIMHHEKDLEIGQR